MRLLVPLILLAGCVATPAPEPAATTQPAPIVVKSVTPKPILQENLIWDRSLAIPAILWHIEAQRRFGGKRVICFIAHGAVVDRRWLCFPPDREPMDVQTVCNVLSDLFPEAIILCLSCNGEVGPKAIDCPRRNVFFSMKPVALIPHSPFSDCATSIWDFRN